MDEKYPSAHELLAEIEVPAPLDPAKDLQKLHSDMRAHLADANRAERNDRAPLHPFVHEHCELRGLKQIKVLDPETMKYVDRPCWQAQAVVAHFHAHGLRHDARISSEMFEKALHQALHGRI